MNLNRNQIIFKKAILSGLLILFTLFTFPDCSKKVLKKVPDVAIEKIKSPAINRETHTVIITVDKKSEKILGEFPWPRSQLGKLLSRLTNSKIVVIGFYLDRVQNNFEDGLLIRAVSRNKKVILPAKLFHRDLYAYESSILYGRDLPMLFGMDVKFSSDKAILPYLAISDYVRNIGFTGFEGHPEIKDRFPLVVEFSGKIYPTLPLAVIKEYFRLTTKDFYVQNNKFHIGNNSLPISYMNLHPNLHADFNPPSYSYADVLSGDYQGDPFSNKIVIISFDLSKGAKKIVSTISNKTQGVAVAQWIETLLDYAPVENGNLSLN